MRLRVLGSSVGIKILRKRIQCEWLLSVLLIICSTSIDFASGVTSCVLCKSYPWPTFVRPANQDKPDCNGPNSVKYSVVCTDINKMFGGGPGLGCQTEYETAQDGITVEKVFRACAVLSYLVRDGLNVTAARTPAGHCYPSGQSQTCVCATDDCNNKQFLSKNSNGEFVASDGTPDQGKEPATPGTNNGNPTLSASNNDSPSLSGSGAADSALDVANNQNAAGPGTGGSQGASSDGAKLCRTSYSLFVFLYLVIIHFKKPC